MKGDGFKDKLPYDKVLIDDIWNDRRFKDYLSRDWNTIDDRFKDYLSCDSFLIGDVWNDQRFKDYLSCDWNTIDEV